MSGTPNPLVVVGRMGNVLEANLAAAKLRGEGIRAQVEPTNAYAATGYDAFLNAKGVGVLVPQSQAEEAATVLEEFGREKQGATPKIGDYAPEIVAGSRKLMRLVWWSLLCTFVFPPLAIFVFFRILKTLRQLKAVESTLTEETADEVRGRLETGLGLIILCWVILGFLVTMVVRHKTG